MVAGADLEHVLQELSRYVVGDVPLDEFLGRVADAANQMIAPVDDASITFMTRGEGAWTAASTGELATTLDESQYALGGGPCVDAATTGTPILVTDMAAEGRWPEFTRRALDVGAGSSLSTPLPIREHAVAALNLYSRRPHAFDDHHLAVAHAVADRAAIAAINALRYESATKLAAELEEAMRNRAVIEQAKGILMATSRCGPDAAFEMLVRASQRENRKLREVARDLVERHSPASDGDGHAE